MIRNNTTSANGDQTMNERFSGTLRREALNAE